MDFESIAFTSLATAACTPILGATGPNDRRRPKAPPETSDAI
jgi:hypothetical protein